MVIWVGGVWWGICVCVCGKWCVGEGGGGVWFEMVVIWGVWWWEVVGVFLGIFLGDCEMTQ